MEILYLYIKDWNSLRNQNLNFGGKYRFHYDKEVKELIVKENPFYNSDFFCLNKKEGNAKIKNITAIVGENGTGKTSILNFIKSNFPLGISAINDSVIIAFLNDDNILRIYRTSDIELLKSNHLEFQADLTIIEKQKTTFPIPEILDTDFIHFSNIFDGKVELEWEGLYDISLNFLIRNDLKRNVESRLINPALYIREIETYVFEEFERQIAFVNAFTYKEFVPFNLPEYIFIKNKRDLVHIDFAFDSREKSMIEDYGFLKLIEKTIEIFNESTLIGISEKKNVEFYFIASCLVNYLIEIATNYNQIKTHVVFNAELIEIKDTSEDIRTFAFKILENFIEQSKNFNPRLDEKFELWTESLKSYFNFLPGIMNDILIPTGDVGSFAIDITKHSNQFKEFFTLYENTYILRPYLNFAWRDLSSGEKALLNILSRFFSLTDGRLRADNVRLKRNIVILIDEGEIYLHPAWQKKFVSLLINFLPLIYAKTTQGETRNIQIILTTNSPFPISDLPNANIIFLEKVNDKILVKDSLEDKRLTFGANIHSLLTDSFFLKNGFIGDYARDKINSVIEILQDKHEIILENKDYIQSVITLIGEPVIKSKLIGMLNDRLSLDLINMEKRVSDLEKDVNNLKKNNNQ